MPGPVGHKNKKDMVINFKEVKSKRKITHIFKKVKYPLQYEEREKVVLTATVIAQRT